jgi:hypothetical protein
MVKELIPPKIGGEGIIRTTSQSSPSLPPAAPAVETPPQPKTYLKEPEAEEAKARAIKEFPELARAGSPLNKEFTARFRRYQQTNPEFFTSPDWPSTLAREAFSAIPPTVGE